MAYIPPEIVSQARQVDLLTYMRACEPGELVHLGNEQYCTREHDSLKISNGKWFWFSRGFGGHTALDYLIKVKQIPFMEAVQLVLDQPVIDNAVLYNQKQPKEKTLLLPKASDSTKRVHDYLRGRGIDTELIDFCIDTGRLYESDPYHNAVFVGLDTKGKPRYAAMRGVGTNFKGEATGSDKRFSFSIPAGSGNRLHLFESAIDLLSYATLCELQGLDWQREHLLSLAGVYKPRAELGESSLPLTIRQYLSDHPGMQQICLHLDNDMAGRQSAQALTALLSQRYKVSNQPPPAGKDCNEYLCMELGLAIPVRSKTGRIR